MEPYDSTNPDQPFTATAPLISLRIVRDAAISVPTQIGSPKDAYELLKERFANADREVMVVIALDTRNQVLAVHPVYYGSLNSAVIRIGEVFKAAVAIGAMGIIVAHNHPSGMPEPSPEDLSVTRQIVAAGTLLDIECLDHLVLGHECFVSMRERRLGFGI